MDLLKNLWYKCILMNMIILQILPVALLPEQLLFKKNAYEFNTCSRYYYFVIHALF